MLRYVFPFTVTIRSGNRLKFFQTSGCFVLKLLCDFWDSTLTDDLFVHKCNNKPSAVVGTADLEISQQLKKQRHSVMQLSIDLATDLHSRRWAKFRGGVWIFSGTTQCTLPLMNCKGSACDLHVGETR